MVDVYVSWYSEEKTKKDKYLYRNTLVKIYNIATHIDCHKYHKISWQPLDSSRKLNFNTAICSGNKRKRLNSDYIKMQSASRNLSSRYLINADLNLLADGRYLMSQGNEFQRRVPWDQKNFNPKSVHDGGTTSSLPFLLDVLLWHFLNKGARYAGWPILMILYINTAAQYVLPPRNSSQSSFLLYGLICSSS